MSALLEDAREMSGIVPPNRPKPGLYPGLSRATYESIDAINVSRLEHFEKSAAHARYAMTHASAPTAAMDTGTATHVAILEPKRFALEYAGAPKVDRRTNAGKAAWAKVEEENPGKTLLDMDEFLSISRMRDEVWAHPIASEMLRGPGHNEVGIVFQNAETGTLCKSLIDRIGGFVSETWVIDVKTTQDASRSEFAKSIRKYNYGAKAAFYLDGCNVVAPRSRRFAWIAVEKKPPYAVAVYEADETALAAGRSKYMRWLRLYTEAKQSGAWSGYPAEIQPMTSEETEPWAN